MAELSKNPFRKKGRFIKSGAMLQNIVSISDFSLSEIVNIPVAYPDNNQGSIIHRSLHNGSDQELGIKNSPEVIKEFPGEARRAIIRPMDFTEEWKKQKARSSRRGRNEDEDEFELGLGAVVASTEPPADPVNEVPAAVEEQAPEAVEEPASFNAFRIQKEAIDQVSSALKHASHESESHQVMIPVITPTDTVDHQFVPMPTHGQAAPENIEKQAVRQYQEQLIDREQVVQEAKARGYEEGFKIGEEKAALQAKQDIVRVTSELNLVLAELEGLKKNILINSQENFQVLCQALMEAILRREFAVNPGSFAAVIERAIQDTVPTDEFRIQLHPSTYESVIKFVDDKLRGKFVANKNIPQGDFRIESNLTVVDGNATQLIRDLLDQADLQLFQDEKGKAS